LLASDVRGELEFFQTVRAATVKKVDTPVAHWRTAILLCHKIRNEAVALDAIVDILHVAGLSLPHISALSGEFSRKVVRMESEDLAL
jgi:type I restriction enzyme R subunit